MAKVEEIKNQTGFDVIIFNEGREVLCLDLSVVKEVIEVDHIKPFPLASKKIEGIINLRDEIVPVINTKLALNLTDNSSTQTIGKSKILVIEHPIEKFGLLVDSIQEILPVEDKLFTDVPDSVQTEINIMFIEQIGMFRNRPLIFLDIDSLIENLFISLPASMRVKSKTKRSSDKEQYIERVERGESRPKDLSISLTDAQSDALKELANIAAGNAITALGDLLKSKKKIDLFVSNVDVMNIADVPDVLGGPDKLVFAVKSEIVKEILAVNYLIFPLDGLAEILFQVAEIDLRKKKIESLGDLSAEERSAIEEIGNILSAHYISAIGDFLGIRLYKETPQLGFDVMGALVDSFLVEQSQYLSEMVCLHTSLKMESMKVDGAFLFLPQKASIKKLMDNLTVDNMVDRLNNKKRPQSTSTKITTETPKVAKSAQAPQKKVVETETPAKSTPKPAKKASKKATGEKVEFTEADLDIFSELGNIGAGHASNALSQMINKKVMIDVPVVSLVAIDKLRPMFDKIGDTVTGTFSLVTKNVDANIVIMFSVQSIENILQIILDLPKPKKLKTITDVSENEQSAIQELNSILIGHYVSALSNFLHVPIDPPKHHFFFEKVDTFFTNLEKDSEKDVVSVIIETKMNVVGTEPIIGYFLMIPAAQNLKEILKRIQEIWEK